MATARFVSTLAVFLFLLLSAPAEAQNEDVIAPAITWDAPDGSADVAWPIVIEGTVGDRSRVAVTFEILSEGSIVDSALGCRTCPDFRFDRDTTEFTIDTNFLAANLEQAVTVRLFATDAVGNSSTAEATFTVDSPQVAITSPLRGAANIGYPIVVRGESEDGGRPFRIDVVFENGPWREVRSPGRRADGSFVARLDPRFLHGWVRTDEPWTVTVQTREFVPVILATTSFTTAPIAGYCRGYAATVDIASSQLPTEGRDIILGTPGNDRIFSGGGNDIICAGAGVDRIFGGDGDDFVSGGDNRDIIDTGEGNDTVYGGSGADRIKLGPGNDFAHGEDGADQIRAGVGFDSIHGGRGINTLYGGAGNDVLNGGNLRSTANGDIGHDLCVRAIQVNCEVSIARPR